MRKYALVCVRKSEGESEWIRFYESLILLSIDLRFSVFYGMKIKTRKEQNGHQYIENFV